MLNTRLLYIIKLIFLNVGISLNDLSNRLNISERMLRYDIENINTIFKYYTNKDVLSIKVSNIIPKIDEYEYLELIKNIPLHEYTLNSVEREKLLITNIFFLDNTFKLSKMSDKYNLSKSTIRTILRNINLKLDEYGIEIKMSNKGYVLLGSEFDIRKYMINTLKEIESETNEFIKNILKDIVHIKYEKNIDEYRKKLLNFLKEEDIRINDEAFEIILLYIYISKNRNKLGNLLKDNEVSNRIFLTNTKEYIKIKEYFECEDFFEDDLLILTDFYLGLYNFNENNSFFLNWINIESLVDNILDNLTEEFNINFNDDNILKKELIHHIKPAIYRISNKLFLTENIHLEVLQEYSDIYYKAENALKCIKDIVNIELDKEEIAYIIIMVKRSIDRLIKIDSIRKTKILIVCGLGYSTSKLIHESLSDNFEVDILDNIPYNQLLNYENLNKVDLIVTTLDFDIKTHEVIKVNPIFKDEDILKLEKYGLKKKSNKINESELLDFIINNKLKNKNEILKEIRRKFKGYIYQDLKKENKRIYEFLNEHNTKFNVNCSNIEQCFEEISKLMNSNGYTEKNYDEVLKRQLEKFGEYILIGDETILPHGELGYKVKKTGFVFITLNKPIEFYGNKVSIIIALASKNKDEHIKAISDLNVCFKTKGFEENIKNINNINDLLIYLKEILNKEVK